VAGAVSMGLGQYVSVSSQRDSEKSLLARGTARVAGDAGAELDELAAIYEAKGVSPRTAAQVDAELRLDPDVLADPAGGGRVCSVVHGRIAVTPARYLVATSDVSASRHLRRRADRVGLAGALSARIGGSHVGRAVLRVVIGGQDQYRQLVPVLPCLPQASTVDEIPLLSSSLVTPPGKPQVVLAVRMVGR